jgi:hypothetical protein
MSTFQLGRILEVQALMFYFLFGKEAVVAWAPGAYSPRLEAGIRDFEVQVFPPHFLAEVYELKLMTVAVWRGRTVLAHTLYRCLHQIYYSFVCLV